jgi:hypothetical protein
MEDQPDARESLRLLLEVWGHQVEAAADGLRGIQVALAWKPEVAIVDLGLPVLDGYEVARRVRAAFHEEGGQPIEGDGSVPVSPRHPLVDLHQDDASRVGGGPGGVTGGAQGTQAVPVRRGELQDGYDERQLPGGEQPGDIGKEHRHEVGPALSHRLP